MSWGDIVDRCTQIAEWARPAARGGLVRSVHGIPRGGCVPAAIIATKLELPLVDRDAITKDTLVVDDLVDSGRTAASVAPESMVVCLYRKSWSPPIGGPVARHTIPGDPWLVFPWELDEVAGVDAVLRLAQVAGMDTADERVIHVAGELCDGIAHDVAATLRAHAL